MAYIDDILALSPDHVYQFNGNDATDSVGANNGTTVGTISSAPLCEDLVNSIGTNGTTDRVTLPSIGTINSVAQERKAVGGWFSVDSIQTPPKRIYGEGNNATTFQFVMAYGNNSMFEVVEPTNFTMQVYGPVLEPNRAYHLFGIFRGNGQGNKIDFYVDGIKQELSEPSDRQPNTLDLNSRTISEFADPAGTVGIGGDVVLLNSPQGSSYNMWAFWGDSANALLTDTQIREELFEKGAIPTTIVPSDTEANIQSYIDTNISSTTRPNTPLDIRIEPVIGDGDLTITLNDIQFDDKSSIHVQYMGTGTLTILNGVNSNASITSAPNGGTVLIVQQVSVAVNTIDASDSSNIEGVRVYLVADSGGMLPQGTVIMNMLSDVSGVSNVAYDYTGDQPVIGRARKGTAPYYKNTPIGGTITSNGLVLNALMVTDE